MSTPTLTTMGEATTVLRGIRWETYERLLEEAETARLVFDRGALEIMSPSPRHERWTRLVDYMVAILAMELGFDLQSGGSTTLRRRRLLRGMEPDACYWIAREAQVRSRDDLDFEVDPMPDLVLEAEASRSVLDRLDILAELGVGEVWRFDGTRLIVLLLDATGAYVESPLSRCLPWLPVEGMAAHLARRRELAQTAWLQEFRAWVREVVQPRFTP